MRRTIILTVALSMILTAAACQRTETASSSPQPAQSAATAPHEMTPEQLGELGAQIKKQPERANELLSQHGMNEESFEQAIRRVTENPDASKRYAEAYKKASV